MAKTPINNLKNWFKTGLKPTQEQFWNWMDSFWHKDEKIPQSAVEDLTAVLSAKAEKTQLDGFIETLATKAGKQDFDDHITDPTAHHDIFENYQPNLNYPAADGKIYGVENGVKKEIVFVSADTNIANTNLTFDSNRTHNLNAKKLKFTNGDFEVPALTLTETAENSKPNKIGTADGLVVKWTNKLGVQRVFAFLSDVLDKTTLIAQSVASQVTFNGTIVHNPAVVSGIKSALVLNDDNEIKQALAVELMADDGSLVKYNDPSELDAIFPTATSGFELICENISTVNFPNGCIYKKTSGGWKVEKLYLISDV